MRNVRSGDSKTRNKILNMPRDEKKWFLLLHASSKSSKTPFRFMVELTTEMVYRRCQKLIEDDAPKIILMPNEWADEEGKLRKDPLRLIIADYSIVTTDVHEPSIIIKPTTAETKSVMQ